MFRRRRRAFVRTYAKNARLIFQQRLFFGLVETVARVDVAVKRTAGVPAFIIAKVGRRRPHLICRLKAILLRKI